MPMQTVGNPESKQNNTQKFDQWESDPELIYTRESVGQNQLRSGVFQGQHLNQKWANQLES